MHALDVVYYLTAALLAVYIYGLRPIARWKNREFPGPKVSWLVGNALSVMVGSQIHTYQKWSEEFGPSPFSILMASETMVVLPDAEDARAALVHAPARPNMTKNSILPKKPNSDPGESLLWARGDRFRSLRAAWQPVFYTGSLKGYMTLMDDAAKLLVAEIKEQSASKDKYFDVQPMIQAMTMNVIGQSAFGVELHTQKMDKAEQSESDRRRSERLLKAANDSLTPIGSSRLFMISRLFPFTVPLLRRLFAWFPEEGTAVFARSRMTLREITDELMEDHQASVSAKESADHDPPNGLNSTHSANGDALNKSTHKVNQANGTSAKENGNGMANGVPGIRKGVKPGSFIDLLVRGSMKDTGESFTANQKAQQVILMLMAGYETSANTLTFLVYLLSRPPNADKQAKVTAEIDELGQTDSLPDYETLEEKMPYLDACVKEALRLFPPGHLLLREAVDDLQLKDYQVKKGQMLAISAYALHRDSRFWGDDANEFRPERWLEGTPQQLKQTKQNFFAFGDGARMCPGQRFAMLEIKITAIRVLQQFSLHLGPHQEPLKLRSTITLGAKDGVFIEAQPRSLGRS